MIKKVFLGVLLVGFAAALTIGAVNRTQVKATKGTEDGRQDQIAQEAGSRRGQTTADATNEPNRGNGFRGSGGRGEGSEKGVN